MSLSIYPSIHLTNLYVHTHTHTYRYTKCTTIITHTYYICLVSREREGEMRRYTYIYIYICNVVSCLYFIASSFCACIQQVHIPHNKLAYGCAMINWGTPNMDVESSFYPLAIIGSKKTCSLDTPHFLDIPHMAQTHTINIYIYIYRAVPHS